MTQWEEIRRQAAVAGRVTDGLTNRPLGGVTVTITAGPASYKAALDRGAGVVCTAADGHYHFLDLPDGQYTLAAEWIAAAARYGKATAAVTVSRGAGGRINLQAADMALPPTAIRGTIKGKADAPLSMATVRVQGSGETALTGTDGAYLLSPVEPGGANAAGGPRSVVISAQGYTAVTRTPTVNPGATAVVDATLVEQ